MRPNAIFACFWRAIPRATSSRKRPSNFWMKFSKNAKERRCQKDVKDPKDPVVQQVVPIEPVKPVVVVAPAGPSHAAAWGATIGGGALVIAGGILTWTGFGMKNDLTARLAHPADALILNTSPTEARADESAYRTRIVAGAGVAAIGVVAVGLGYWLLAVIANL